MEQLSSELQSLTLSSYLETKLAIPFLTQKGEVDSKHTTKARRDAIKATNTHVKVQLSYCLPTIRSLLPRFESKWIVFHLRSSRNVVNFITRKKNALSIDRISIKIKDVQPFSGSIPQQILHSRQSRMLTMFVRTCNRFSRAINLVTSSSSKEKWNSVSRVADWCHQTVLEWGAWRKIYWRFFTT